jgi:predicted transcriptional regulator
VTTATSQTSDQQPADRRDREPLWRHLIGDVLRRQRQRQERTLKEVAEAARISLPYLSEIERGRKEASSEVLAAAAHALGLRLSDLLALVQHDLTRLEMVRVVSTVTDQPRHTVSAATGRTGRDALCLAA